MLPCSRAYESVTVYYPSSDKIMLNLSAFYCVCLPVGHTMKVHYLSGTHFCQNVALRYFHCFLVILVLNVELPFEIWNHHSTQTAVFLNVHVHVMMMETLCASCFHAALGPHLCLWKWMLKGTSQKKKITHNKTQAQRQEDLEGLEGSLINKTNKHSAYKSAQFICFPTV